LEHDAMHIGTFELDVQARELCDGDRRVRLQTQPFEILCALLERPGDVITRDELRQRLWPGGTFVDFEHSLNTAIKRLRAALGDDAGQPRFVETVPRRGYRYIAGRSQQRVRARVRLVVLPFSAISEQPGCEQFSEGLTEEVIVQLGALSPDVEIVAPWSSRFDQRGLQRTREIGDMLQASAVLEGSTRHDGSRARITARLVDTATEVHLWSETYERILERPLSVQADVGSSVARAIRETLPSSRTTAPWS
jgi:TolB-like protein